VEGEGISLSAFFLVSLFSPDYGSEPDPRFVRHTHLVGQRLTEVI
jgi:hypothetical protein